MGKRQTEEWDEEKRCFWTGSSVKLTSVEDSTESAEWEIRENAGDWSHFFARRNVRRVGQTRSNSGAWTLRAKRKRGGERRRERDGKRRGDADCDRMDEEWETRNESSLGGCMRDLRVEMAEMSLRIVRLERVMPLGCEESGSSSGGGEWAWWSGAWWVKTKMKMNSANGRKVHRATSQPLGKTGEGNRGYERENVGH